MVIYKIVYIFLWIYVYIYLYIFKLYIYIFIDICMFICVKSHFVWKVVGDCVTHIYVPFDVHQRVMSRTNKVGLCDGK